MRRSYLAISACVVLVTTTAGSDGRGVSQAGAQASEEPDALGSVSAVAEVENFCCPDYLTTIVAHIRRNWTPPPPGMVAATAGVKFTIASDGRVDGVSLEKRSGNGILDMGALHAMSALRQLPPLPADFKRRTLTVRVAFEYGKPTERTSVGPQIQFDARGVDFGPWIRTSRNRSNAIG